MPSSITLSQYQDAFTLLESSALDINKRPNRIPPSFKDFILYAKTEAVIEIEYHNADELVFSPPGTIVSFCETSCPDYALLVLKPLDSLTYSKNQNYMYKGIRSCHTPNLKTAILNWNTDNLDENHHPAHINLPLNIYLDSHPYWSARLVKQSSWFANMMSTTTEKNKLDISSFFSSFKQLEYYLYLIDAPKLDFKSAILFNVMAEYLKDYLAIEKSKKHIFEQLNSDMSLQILSLNIPWENIEERLDVIFSPSIKSFLECIKDRLLKTAVFYTHHPSKIAKPSLPSLDKGYVTLKNDTDEESVSKATLMDNSMYFKQLFNSGMAESYQEIIDCSTIAPKPLTIKLLLGVLLNRPCTLRTFQEAAALYTLGEQILDNRFKLMTEHYVDNFFTAIYKITFKQLLAHFKLETLEANFYDNHLFSLKVPDEYATKLADSKILNRLIQQKIIKVAHLEHHSTHVLKVFEIIDTHVFYNLNVEDFQRREACSKTSFFTSTKTTFPLVQHANNIQFNSSLI